MKNYYHILSLAPTATAEEIKTAYHNAAKRAHPDAGGSAEAMQLINEAYAVLGDANERAAYDLERKTATTPAPPPKPPSEPVHPHRTPAPHGGTAHAEAHLNYRLALRQARGESIKLMALSVLASTLLVPLMPYAASVVTNSSAKAIFALIAFAPVYLTAVAAIFIARPRLRVAIAVIGHKNNGLTHHDRTALAGIALGVIPLAAIWVLLFRLGLMK